MKIENALSSEYEYIQRFLEDVYGHSFNYFPAAYPYVWKKHTTDFKNIFVIREKGKIVSLVRIFPLKTIQNGVEIDLAGIGSVSTLYSHRGKGYMSLLLQHTFEKMKQEGFPLSVLGGDRHRYNNFGYENAGKVIELEIFSRGLKKYGVKAFPALRYDNTDKKILHKIMGLIERSNYRKIRTVREFEEVYRKQGINVYYTVKGMDFAFVVVSAIEVMDSGMKSIVEFGGKPELIAGILQHLVERFGFTGFKICFPDFTEIPSDFISFASSWDIRSGMMLKIINLKKTLEGLSKRDDFLFPDDKEITLTIKDRESVIISKKDGILKIENGRGENEISLTEIEMVRLLFGTFFWVPEKTDKKVIGILRQFLPMSIYLPYLDLI
ncbi:MAG: GNAT family N-acetyltransferase [bacterium]|nr:GNAT family N-acetyltransferase [bacterium]